MVVEIIEIPSLALEKVHYYTVRLENKGVSEFRDFQAKAGQAFPVELGEINRYIQLIGNRYGAEARHFKGEDAAERLPPPYHQFIESDDPQDFGLRLYCIRLSPSVVILLNGDKKTALKVKDCKRCYPHFDLARRIAKKIDAAIISGDISIDVEDKEILIEDEFELTV